MTQEVDPGEVVGFGASRERRTLRSSARAHPWLSGAVVVVTVVAVGVVVVARRTTPPELPAVTASAAPVPDDAREYQEPFPWSPGLDGRPEAPVVLTRQTDVHLSTPPPSGGSVELRGIAGPGIGLPPEALERLTGGNVDTTLTTETRVDCAKVSIPVPAGSYGLAVRVDDGTRSTSGVVDAGAVGAEWAQSIQLACESWLARRDVTVSAATVVPDPKRPRATLALTVTNAGTRDARLRVKPVGDEFTVSSTPAGDVVVPAGGSVRLDQRITIKSCDSLAAIKVEGSGTGAPVAVVSDLIGLTGVVGPARDLAGTAESWAYGFGPTGLVLSGTAAQRLSDGLRAACGGIDGFAVLVDPNGTDYDAAARTLDVRVLVDTPPGVLHDLRLVPDTGADRTTSFVAVSGRTARLVPDRTGQVATTLRYEAPKRSMCPSPDLFLPGFTMIARVPAGDDSYKTVRFTHFAVQWQDALVRKKMCGTAG